MQKLKNSAKQNSWRVCRFSPWNLARCFRIWLGAFDKSGLFGCQSGIRGLWLEGLSKEGLFGCQSAPGPPYAVPSLFDAGVLISEFSVS